MRIDPQHRVAVTAPADAERAIAVVTLAFAADPAARWSFADPALYLKHFAAFARLFGGRAFEHGGAWHAEGFAGAALWLPPGVGPEDEAMAEMFAAVAPPEALADGQAVFEQMARHHPKEPHWYLPLMGVDPARQGRGVGAALMAAALRRVDEDGALAYLESSSERNIPLYERFGFEVIGAIQAGASPTITPMLRRPRR